MKKGYYLAGLLCLTVAGSASAQSLSEDFEGWGAGTYMGTNSADWSTWSGATGGAEDVQVSTAQASSGSNSIYFSSTALNGGPQDVIVDFGGEHNTGNFNFNSDFYVDNGQGAYFNFQANTTPGLIWSFNCQMNDSGEITFDDGSTVWLTTTYPQATWFNLEIDVDLNTNSWDILIDGSSVGTFQAVEGQIATIDIFPVNSAGSGNGQSSFYMDDFNYSVTPFALPAENGAVSFITDIAGLASMDIMPTVTVRNLGTTAITSFDLEVDYNGSQITENITGVNIASMGTYDVTFTSGLTLVGGTMDVTATVSNVNGNGADANAADDSKSISVSPVVPAPGKMVVGEEATGTWCQWCPRGAVFMDLMADNYDGFWAGIAVHNGDPMTYEPYDASMSALVSNSYPSAVVDRSGTIDPSEMEIDFLERIVLPPSAFITNGAIWNDVTRELQVSVTADWQSTETGTWRLAMVLTEDGVAGTGAGWSQSNAYAGGGSGVMGGYETLPNPVPASMMIYDHVGRVILPSFSGYTNSFPSTNSGEVHTVNFTLVLDDSWDVDNMHIVGMLVAPNGSIENADQTTIPQAETNGFVTSTEVVTSITELSTSGSFEMYPNPTANGTTISVTDLDNDEVIVKVFDINGKIVAQKNYGMLTGAMKLPINTENFEAGIYTVQLMVGETQNVQKLIVE